MTTRVKICCIASIEEARLALAHGAAALGFVSAMPSGAGVIDNSRIVEIVAELPSSVRTFLLTSRTDPEAVVQHVRSCGTNTVQIVDTLDGTAHEQIRGTLPDITIVQVVHVTGLEALAEARDVAPSVDAILLDSGNPTLAVKELGGTGRVHDWQVSRAIVDAVDCPVYLAGGLNPDNVREAIRTVRPHAVDLCNGVRIEGRLEPRRLEAFFQAVAVA